MQPPTVRCDAQGVVMLFDGVPQWSIRWSQIQKAAIEVVAIPDADWAEGSWILTGDDVSFYSPTEIVVGSEDLNARLFSLPGFDLAEFQRAKDAEANRQDGFFMCWQSQN